MARLFGTDGVRGIANVELTPELAFKLGRAAASYFGRETRNPKIIIGRDTRLSGTMLEAALAAGICSAGGNAHLLGVIPTPAVSYLTSKLHANAGAVISASHNPFEDNGIKFFSQTGHKLPDAVEDEIEAMVAVHIQDRGRGKIRQIFQVFLGQVAAGKDQVDPLQPLPCAVIPQCFGGGIRNRKYLHVRNAPFC